MSIFQGMYLFDSSFYRTSDKLKQPSSKLERVHLLLIELEHPIFGFERSNIELRTLFNPSLIIAWKQENSLLVENIFDILLFKCILRK